MDKFDKEDKMDKVGKMDRGDEVDKEKEVDKKILNFTPCSYFLFFFLITRKFAMSVKTPDILGLPCRLKES